MNATFIKWFICTVKQVIILKFKGMKKLNFKKVVAIAVSAIALSTTSVFAQEEEASKFSSDAGIDIYSSYIWRGAKFGTGAALQPWMSFTAGNFEIGSWNSVNSGGVEAFEADLYASYSFDFGLGIAVTDYYFGGAYFGDSCHYIEPALSFEKGSFSFLGAYMLNAEDMYVELGYSFKLFDIAIGAGDGQYTTDGNFNVCNVSIKKSKDLQITDKFTIPVSAGITLNPSTEGFFGYVGLSF